MWAYQLCITLCIALCSLSITAVSPRCPLSAHNNKLTVPDWDVHPSRSIGSVSISDAPHAHNSCRVVAEYLPAVASSAALSFRFHFRK